MLYTFPMVVVSGGGEGKGQVEKGGMDREEMEGMNTDTALVGDSIKGICNVSDVQEVSLVASITMNEAV